MKTVHRIVRLLHRRGECRDLRTKWSEVQMFEYALDIRSSGNFRSIILAV